VLVDLAKRPTSRDGLHNIKNEEGEEFEIKELRGRYIRSFYEKRFRSDDRFFFTCQRLALASTAGRFFF
jgi:hypothetical protein